MLPLRILFLALLAAGVLQAQPPPETDALLVADPNANPVATDKSDAPKEYGHHRQADSITDLQTQLEGTNWQADSKVRPGLYPTLTFKKNDVEPAGYRYSIDPHDFTVRIYFNHGDTQLMLLREKGRRLGFTFQGKDYSYALAPPIESLSSDPVEAFLKSAPASAILKLKDKATAQEGAAELNEYFGEIAINKRIVIRTRIEAADSTPDGQKLHRLRAASVPVKWDGGTMARLLSFFYFSDASAPPLDSVSLGSETTVAGVVRRCEVVLIEGVPRFNFDLWRSKLELPGEASPSPASAAPQAVADKSPSDVPSNEPPTPSKQNPVSPEPSDPFQPKLLRITGTIDGSGRIIFTRYSVIYEHKHWSRPTNMTFDSEPWNLQRSPDSWVKLGPQLDLTKAWIVKRSGRDMIALEHTADGFDLYLCDSPNGSAFYEVIITIPRR